MTTQATTYGICYMDGASTVILEAADLLDARERAWTISRQERVDVDIVALEGAGPVCDSDGQEIAPTHAPRCTLMTVAGPSADTDATERATASLAKLYYAYLYDAHDVTDAVQASAVRALRQADAAGRAWTRSTKALARAYLALGATPPAGATGYDWHRGAHPLQVAMRQLAATVEAEP